MWFCNENGKDKFAYFMQNRFNFIHAHIVGIKHVTIPFITKHSLFMIEKYYSLNIFTIANYTIIIEPLHKKTNKMLERKQRHRSASG